MNSNISNSFSAVSNKPLTLTELTKTFVLIAACAIAFTALLIANPGYFNHDELQKLDFVHQYGLSAYMSEYVRIKQGLEFGDPVRPFSFLLQGLLALLIQDYPVLVHLFAVLVHATVGFLIFKLLHQLGAQKKISLSAAIIFTINPLSMVAAGWSAALMDQWYVLFGLFTLICADQYIRGSSRVFYLCLIFLGSALAMLSKETALILPGLLLIIAALHPFVLRHKRFWLAFFVWCLPIILFLLYRLPALLASFGGSAAANQAYKASISNIPNNLFIYFSYPFSVLLTGAENWVFMKPYQLWLAILIHAALVVAIALTTKVRYAVAYCCCYFLFLAPILLISIKGAHYLYGSSIVLSTGLAFVLMSQRNNVFTRFFGLCLIGILVAHAVVLQEFIYSIGSCMNRMMSSAESVYLSENQPKSMTFQAEPGAPEHVLYRSFFGRNQLGSHFPVDLKVSPWNTNVQDGSLTMIMDQQCILRKKN